MSVFSAIEVYIVFDRKDCSFRVFLSYQIVLYIAVIPVTPRCLSNKKSHNF